MRTCVLAAALQTAAPDAEISIVSGSPALASFAPAGVHTLKLPTLPRAPGGEPAIRATRRRLFAWRRRLLRETCDELRPGVLLVDHVPLGKKSELATVLPTLVEQGTRVVLGYRRIHEDREVTERLLSHGPQREALERWYDRALIYAPSWVEQELGPLPGLTLPSTHVGFVTRAVAVSRVDARARLGVAPDARLVVASFGGGRDAWPLVLAVVAAWRDIQPAGGHLWLYCGTHMAVQRADLRGAAGVSLWTGRTDFPLAAAAADGVLTTGGYNSVLEVLRVGTPLFIAPHQTGEVEQVRSAALLERLGLARSTSVDQAGLESALRALLRVPTDRRRPAPDGWFDGAATAAAELLRLHDGSPPQREQEEQP